MTEEWRTVAEFPDYAVSSHGNVRRIKVDARGHHLTGKNLKPCANKAGYLHVSLCLDGVVSNKRINRLVCAAFHGEPPCNRHHAAHNDGDRRNNRADNLRWALPVENEADKRVHGTARIGDRHWSKSMPERRARGVGHGRAKLDADAVRSIRADTRFQRVIAADHGVSQRVVWMVKRGLTWGHVA